MRIAFTTSSLSSGGAERVASILASAWASRGDDVTLIPTFSGGGECFYKLHQRVKLAYLADHVSKPSMALTEQLGRLLGLRRLICEARPDVIVSFLSNVNVAAIVASAGLRIPIVVCERTDPFVMPIPPLLQLGRLLTYPFADALVVQTNAVAQKYIRSSWMLCRPRVIPNPVSSETTQVVRCPSRANKRLIAVGSLVALKQFDVLVQVFSRLAMKHVDWTLRIIGEGPLRTDLEKLVSTLALGHRVELPGRTVQVEDELAEADAFVMTSRYEGFPNALLEAMAVGLPCAAYDCPSGPRELTANGSVGLLVPLNDTKQLTQALDSLMSDANLRDALGASARTSVIKRFSLSSILTQWDGLLQEVAGKT